MLHILSLILWLHVFFGFGRLTLTAKGILVFPHDVLSPLKMEKSCLMRVVCHTQNETFRVCYRQIQGVECAAHKIMFSECATKSGINVKFETLILVTRYLD